MSAKTAKDVIGLCRIGNIVAVVKHELGERLKPGVKTKELDDYAGELLAKYQARSAPKLCYNFPGNVCISVNEQAAHGIPNDRIINPGDIVNIDVSAELDGYFADTGSSFMVPPIVPLAKKLCGATQTALNIAIKSATAGRPIRDIEKIYRKTAKREGFNVIQTLTGHGIGRNIHEYPEYIPNYGSLWNRDCFREKMVITLEPFFSTKGIYTRRGRDGWVETMPLGTLVAQYEHTLIIGKKEPIVTTVLS